MHGLVKNISKQCAIHFIRTHTELFSEDFFRQGDIGSLLVEALDDEDKGEMEKALSELDTLASDLGAALPDTDATDGLIQAIGATLEVDWAVVYDEKADAKSKAKATAELTKALQDAMGEISALVQCFESLKQELGKFKPSDPSQTIGDLAKAAEEGGDGAEDFPTTDDIAKAVEKAYAVPEWYNKAWQAGTKEAESEAGGFFNKVAGFISGLFGGDTAGNLEGLDKGAVTAAVLSYPFEDFAAINLSTIQGKLVTATETVGAETGEASAAAAAQQAGEDSAKSRKTDIKAAEQGVETLTKDPDTGKEVLAAVEDALEPGDAQAFKSALAGKLADLAKRQQDIIAQILALYAGGPDGATPEKAAEVADAAEEAADAEVSSSFKNLDALADLGDAHLGDGGGELVKTMLSDEEASKLFAAHRLPVGRKLHENRLTSLLFEQEEEAIPIEDVVAAFTTVGKAAGQSPDEKAVTAWATEVNDQELLDKKIAVAAGEADEEAPLSDEEGEKEQETVAAELEAAAQDAVTEPEAPGVAIATALDSWAGGLSKTSQSSLTSKNRLASLKDLVNQALDSAATALEGEVEAAIDIWRGEHEETLIKSKRFAKKNFDSLGSLIPQIASAMLKKTSESNVRLTRGMVHKSVHRYLDRKFGREGMLIESGRWEELAGLRG